MTKPSFNPLEFLSTPWGQMPIGAAMPGANPFNPADLKELDKRIAELKAVEQWLNLNQSLLKTTIQALEVQRGTIAAIQSFGESMAKASAAASGTTGPARKKTETAGAAPGKESDAFVAAPAAGTDQAAFWWESMQQQFGQMMKAAQASAQSMVETKPKNSRKSGGKTSSETSGDTPP
jgi:hypothetical protein